MLLPFLSLSQLSPFSLLQSSFILSLSLIAAYSPSTWWDVILHHLRACQRSLHLFLPRILPFLSKHKSAAKKVQIIKKRSEFKAAGKLTSQPTRVKREREVYLSRASMVFPSPSVPVYLDPHPPNWNNQVLHELLSSSPSIYLITSSQP